MTESFNPSPEDIEVYGNLGRMLDKFRPTPGSRINNTWYEYRKGAIEKFGEHAIATLIPQKINVSSTLITRALNNPARNGVKTMQDLVCFDLDDFMRDQPKDFGSKSLEFAKALKAVSEIELKRKS